MSCIEVKVSQVNNPCQFNAKVSRTEEDPSVTVKRIGGELYAKMTNISESLAASVTRISKEVIKARCRIICNLEQVLAFIDVSPNEIQWVTEDMGVYFDVVSNVEWIIVTD